MPIGPSYADFDRDYHAPDREDVLSRMRAESQPAPSAMRIDQPWMQQPQQPPMDRTAFRDAWMSAGQMTPQQADQWMMSHGATPVAGGEKAGRWQVPGGDILDTQIGRGNAMATGGMITPGWTPTGMPPGQQQQPPMWGDWKPIGGSMGGGWGQGQMHGMPWTQQGLGWGMGGSWGRMPGQTIGYGTPMQRGQATDQGWVQNQQRYTGAPWNNQQSPQAQQQQNMAHKQYQQQRAQRTPQRNPYQQMQRY